jgi:hypothetical protein
MFNSIKNKKKFLVIILSLIISSLLAANYLMKYYFEKRKNLFKNYDHVYFTEKYVDKLHHLRGRNHHFLDYKNPHEFIFNYLNKDENKETLLIQGGYKALFLNKEASIQGIKDMDFLKKFNFINAGTVNYSISPMLVQLNVLRNDFKIKPDKIVIFIDPADLGDEVCRYKDLIRYENDKIVSLKKEPNNKDVYWYNYDILASKIKFYEGPKIIYLPDLMTYIVRDRIFQNKKIRCNNNEIQKPLINEVKESNDYYKKLLGKYINEAFSDKKLKHMYIVSYPYIEHYTERNGIKYKVKLSDLVENVLKDNKFKNKITHINFYKQGIFPEMGKDFLEYITVGEEDGSHLNAKGNYIFYQSIFKKIN